MADKRTKKTGAKDGSAVGSEQGIIERRASARKPFRASALVVEVRSGIRLKAETNELGAEGCFIDTLNPFAVGALVRVQLQRGKETLESNARVVYHLPIFGMGIVFLDLTPEQKSMLQAWLQETPQQ